MVNLAPNFARVRNGYDPQTVAEFINEQAYIQQALEAELNSVQSQLSASTAQVDSLRTETAQLATTSTSPQAMTDRIAKMLRVAVDEVSEMQYEARLEAESMVISAQAEAEASQAKVRQQLAELAARQRAMETEYAEVMNRAREEAARIVAQAVSESERMREVETLRRDQAESELNAELTRLRRETEAKVEEQVRTTAQECEFRILDSKAEAERRLRVANEQIDRRLQDARRALDEIAEKRISVLEQLSEIHGSLQSIPTILDNAYREPTSFRNPVSHSPTWWRRHRTRPESTRYTQPRLMHHSPGVMTSPTQLGLTPTASPARNALCRCILLPRLPPATACNRWNSQRWSGCLQSTPTPH
jgi:chromosome segregation ATPase